MRTFKKVFTACAVAAVAAAFCMTILPSSVTASNSLAIDSPSIGPVTVGCTPKTKSDCASPSTGNVYFNKRNF